MQLELFAKEKNRREVVAKVQNGGWRHRPKPANSNDPFAIARGYIPPYGGSSDPG